MPSILSDDDRQTVKRTVPKASNKIHAVGVAKLYVAYPDRNRWTYTGIQGAAVLANDLVGNTFWVKIVDVSPSNRGVIWDQEIYDTFQYNTDRTFFHTFELEECLAGLSFADEKEAKQFKKKMDERESNAHKNTRSRPFASGISPGGTNQQAQQSTGKSRFGLSKLFGGHGHSNTPQAPAQSIIPPQSVNVHATPAQSFNHSVPSHGIDLNDPAVQNVLQDLKKMGITEDQIEEHAGFIKSYLEQHKAQAKTDAESRRAPPPPPPGVANISPQHTGSSGSSKRGPPPVAPPSRRTGGVVTTRPPSPPASPELAPSPPRPRFRAPPPIEGMGKYANTKPPPSLPNRDGPALPSRDGPALPSRDGPALPSRDGPPAPPRPAKIPLDTTPAIVHQPPPPPPARSNVAPSVPPRDATVPPPPPRPVSNEHVPAPPPLPPSTSRPAPSSIPAPPPLPPTTSRAGPSNVPPPPPMPPRSAADSSQAAIPSAVPPPPPPPAQPPRSNVAAAPSAVPGRDGLLADIRGGARLKKVSDSEKRDRSAAMVPGSTESAQPQHASTPSDGGQGGLAGALASALAARKSKVSHSDDEDDNDDW